ncbi:N-6 DNA methylase [Thermococcus sp. 21S9]|uniref:N-6 DNA methylase n=2 Tax=unclassified Thermococcus TaxID=2627626 RepID=UPI001439A2BB|nr:N-6 DNA methylase [Thermococcus sp. 21S9]NJE54660.1 SAM-dependent DNA methyltransferase [Thermococcus sp. 21S9]
MSLREEIQRVHDHLYSEIGGTKPLLPLVLTLLYKHKEIKMRGSKNPLEELKRELERLDKNEIKKTLTSLLNKYSNIEENPLLGELIRESIDNIEELPPAKLERAKKRLLKADEFLQAMDHEDDFIGILFETLATHSKVFDKKEGRFFTPKNIILLVVEMMASLLEKENADFTKITVLDPCCGSARYLVQWANRLKRENLIPLNNLGNYYPRNLFGIDISRDVAKWATWNMVFHGDGATNIENADSLNYYGYLVYWDLIQTILRELPEKLESLEDIQQEHIQEMVDYIKKNLELLKRLTENNEIDISSEEIRVLFTVLNNLVHIHHKVHIEGWDAIEELSKRKDYPSLLEITKFKWAKRNSEVVQGFDVIITNPPFGRSGQDLMVTNPYILAQYKLATQKWLGDLTRDEVENLIKKVYGINAIEFYKECLKEIGIGEIMKRYKIKFNDLPAKYLKSLARKYGIPEKGRKSEIVSNLSKKLGRDYITGEDMRISINVLPDNLIKQIAYNILYITEGNKTRISEELFTKLKDKLGTEWVSVGDVYGYDYKLVLKDSANEETHEIFFYNGIWIEFNKKNIEKKVVRLLKENEIPFEVTYRYSSERESGERKTKIYGVFLRIPSTKLNDAKNLLSGMKDIYIQGYGYIPLLFRYALPKQVVFLEEFLRLVKNGGYVFTVIDTGILSNSEDEYVRRFLYRFSRIHAIVEFPHNAFKAAGTSVKTAVILYQKLKQPPEDYEIFGALPQNLGYVLNKQETPPDPDHNDLGKVLCDWRLYLGLGRMCDPAICSDAEMTGDERCKLCAELDSTRNDTEKERKCCLWYKLEHCPVWRIKIEKSDI